MKKRNEEVSPMREMESIYPNIEDERPKKSRIVNKIGSLVVAGALVVGCAGIAIEANVDHTEELCPLCSIFGYEHQVKAINRTDDYTAEFTTIRTVPEGFTVVTKESGESYGQKVVNPVLSYAAPEGYIYVGNGKCVKQEDYEQYTSGDKLDEDLDIVDAKTNYSAPSGYVLSGDKAYKYSTVTEVDAIKVTNVNDGEVHTIRLG